MAVMVTWVLTVTAGPVYRPLVSIEPMLAVQVTVSMKLPVPVTVAVHWLVWPDWTDVGVHVIVTPVIVEVLELPLPLHAEIPSSMDKERMRARKRKLVPQETERKRLKGRKSLSYREINHMNTAGPGLLRGPHRMAY